MRLLKFWFSVLTLALILVGCGQQAEPIDVAVDIDMTIKVEQEPLAVGDTALIVMLKDRSGAPINGATLQVHADMDHAGMEPVDREVSDSIDGEYRVPFEWTMGGGWIVTVTAHLPDEGGEVSETFDFFVEAVSSESVINHDAMDMESQLTPESTSDGPMKHQDE